MSANKVPLSFRLQNGAKVDVEVELDSLVGDLKVRKGGAVVWVGAQLTLRARLLSATPCRTSWRLWYVGPRPPPKSSRRGTDVVFVFFCLDEYRGRASAARVFRACPQGHEHSAVLWCVFFCLFVGTYVGHTGSENRKTNTQTSRPTTPSMSSKARPTTRSSSRPLAATCPHPRGSRPPPQRPV